VSKKILITGGAGFIGHQVIKKILQNTDWELFVIDRLSYAGNLNRINDVVEEVGDGAEKRIEFISPFPKNRVSDTSKSIFNKFKKGPQIEFKKTEILINDSKQINSLKENDSIQNLVWNSKFSARKYIDKSSNLIYKKNFFKSLTSCSPSASKVKT